ncbi:natriuretic peptides A-like [Conger conger]|uniref:natriuretic peptides A-like n=1 Tax=Conger conger TaxID=82655 RepID=UPI002A5A4A6F|nr:natriuretic peptides A-like [Conger conger]
MRKIILPGLLLVLLCQQAMVTALLSSRAYSAKDLARLKSLLEQFEDTLAGEKAPNSPGDYEDATAEEEEEAKQGQPGRDWDRERGGQGLPSDPRGPGDGYEAQRSQLLDLLMSTRSKSCFGGRLDRIGSYSGLGCNTRKV